MAEESKQRGLGRGLQALLGDGAPPADTAPSGKDTSNPGADRQRGMRDVPIEFLKPNPHQPRRNFSETDLEELAQSIRERGVLQPIIVRPDETDRNAFQIVAGERRWRAAQKAQRHTVPVIVKDLSDSEVLEIGLVENIQRADLNPLEEASGYQVLMQKFKYTQDQLSKLIGKSRSHVANMTRLLSLPEPVQDMVKTGALSAGHARTLVGSDKAEDLAREIVSKALNVRQAEALVRRDEEAHSGTTPAATRSPSSQRGSRPVPAEKDADTIALERNVSNALGLPVVIEFRGTEGGDVKISYTTLEQLDDVCRRLAQPIAAG